MKIKSGAGVLLQVVDLEKTIAFYDALGLVFQVNEERGRRRLLSEVGWIFINLFLGKNRSRLWQMIKKSG